MLNENDRLRILDYLSGRLAADERARFEADLERNEELHRELAQHREADGWLGALPRQQRSDAEIESFVQRTVQAAQAEESSGSEPFAPLAGITAGTPIRGLDSVRARRRAPFSGRLAAIAAAALVVATGLYFKIDWRSGPGSSGARAPTQTSDGSKTQPGGTAPDPDAAAVLPEEAVLAILADPEIESSFDVIERLSLLTDEELAQALEVDDADWFLLESLSGA